MRLSVILLFLGFFLIGYSISLSPYKDENAFRERYMALSVGQSAEYWKLRDEMVTPKFQLQDYGGTAISLAVLVFAISRKGLRQFASPKTNTMLSLVGFAAPCLSVGAYVFDLFQGFAREEYPHWADSLGIPLMGVPFSLLFLLMWSGAHLLYLRRAYKQAPLVLAFSRKSNWWLLFLSAITFAFVILCILGGQYWYFVASVVWLYFYISLATMRHASNAESIA